MKVDLHIHTCFSDGGKDLQSIFKELKDQNVEVASITDHNNIDAYYHLENIEMFNIKIIKGIEIDVEYKGLIYHLLMYGANDNSPLFIQYLNNCRQHSILEFKRMISDLEQKNNVKIDEKNIQQFIDKNQYFDKVRLNNLLCEIGLVQTPVEAFYNYTKEIDDAKRFTINAESFF